VIEHSCFPYFLLLTLPSYTLRGCFVVYTKNMEHTKNMKHWSRNHFDPQKDTTDNWIRLHGLVAETDIVGGDNLTYHGRLSNFKVDSDRSRDNVRTMFTELMTANLVALYSEFTGGIWILLRFWGSGRKTAVFTDSKFRI
jgi:hypothetical protein